MSERVAGETKVLLIAPGEAMPMWDGKESPLYVKYRGVELLWSASVAVLQCEPDGAEGLLEALTEFGDVESELRRIEREVGAVWHEVEEDTAVAFDVDKVELRRNEEVGGRMERAFRRRICFARMEPKLYAPGVSLSVAGRKLGEELREKAEIEDRAEVLDGQLAVFEHVYEMAGQRLGEFRAARQGHITEVVIIWILALEALLMAGDVIVRVMRH